MTRYMAHRAPMARPSRQSARWWGRRLRILVVGLVLVLDFAAIGYAFLIYAVPVR